ncbi:hypothetical protein ACG3SL_19265 [Sphingomonas sp. CJ20]
MPIAILPLALAATLVAAPIRPDPAAGALSGLTGCWDAPGQVMGKPVRMAVRGSWRLGERYILVEMHGLDPADPYDAAIVMGGHDGDKLAGWWMDSFGAGYSAAGKGAVTNGVLEIDYAYPDAGYRNRLERKGKGWHWTITERKPDGSTRAFAAYDLTPTPCGDQSFPFDVNPGQTH